MLSQAGKPNPRPTWPARSRYRDANSRSGPIGAPHLLEIVEAANLGPEDVHQHVARIDQHPVAGWHALDPGVAVSPILHFLDEFVGDRADMPLRSARRDDHRVGERGLPDEIDGDRLLGLHLVEAFEGEGLEVVRARLTGLTRSRNGSADRLRGVGFGQRPDSSWCRAAMSRPAVVPEIGGIGRRLQLRRCRVLAASPHTVTDLRRGQA